MKSKKISRYYSFLILFSTVLATSCLTACGYKGELVSPSEYQKTQT